MRGNARLRVIRIPQMPFVAGTRGGKSARSEQVLLSTYCMGGAIRLT